MFDIISEALARMRAQDRFGGEPSGPAASEPAHAPSPLPWFGATGPAVPGVVSPAAETVLDERETYLANSASFDSKWANDSLLSRALARSRGENVADPAIKPELGAPGAARPLRDPQQVIAEAMAQSAPKPAAAPPAAERPYTGLSPQEEYEQRRAAMSAKSGGGGMSFFERAMARSRGEKVADPAIKPERGAPASARPLRDPQTVIAETMAQSAPKPSAPAPAPARPYTGLSPQEEYEQRRAAMNAKSGDQSFLQQALARHAARKGG